MNLEPEEYEVLRAIGELEQERKEQGVHDAFGGLVSGHLTRHVNLGHRTIKDVLLSLAEKGHLEKNPAVYSWWRDDPSSITVSPGFKLTDRGHQALARVE